MELKPASDAPSRDPFTTIDDCVELADELSKRLSRLGNQRHPLDVRRGVWQSAGKSGSRTLKASSRTYFFDVKSLGTGQHYLVITESRLKDKQRAQITVFPEDAHSFSSALELAIRDIG